mgnify:CR=1 FL=1|tara:strand:+ start:5336 stop:5815 length:480 start_codon:yes stop_codon:yes gene_type:complete
MGDPIKVNLVFGEKIPEKGVCCVYQLINEKGITFYVGQTLDLKKRLYQHILDGKSPYSFSYDVVDEGKANNIEAGLIITLKPELNKSIPTNDFYTLKSTLKKELSKKLLEFVNSIEPDFEIKSKAKWRDQHIHAYNDLIIRDTLAETFDELLKTVNEGK